MCTSLEKPIDKDMLALKDNLHWLNLFFHGCGGLHGGFAYVVHAKVEKDRV